MAYQRDAWIQKACAAKRDANSPKAFDLGLIIARVSSTLRIKVPSIKMASAPLRALRTREQIADTRYVPARAAATHLPLLRTLRAEGSITIGAVARSLNERVPRPNFSRGCRGNARKRWTDTAPKANFRLLQAPDPRSLR